ncbi:flagellin [Bradyrhizobium sp.]|uniref:flagellin N-terminal helical domain-containing protein n=1 Tax=Bradyrhizobium sp. TaxID=376 RepID=UPI002736A945|nr:flagellin [Bradyrhizobium sp.]MDP3691073.1 flagellin [Bradyrhizobium sp.]
MSGIVLSASVRQNLLSLQSTAELLATTQSRLSTGKKVNTALDNPTNFFTAASLDNRASDISNLLDGIGNGVQVLQAANTGITSLQKLVDSAKSVANQALQAAVGYSAKSSVSSAAIAGATVDNLLGGSASNAVVAGTSALATIDLTGTAATNAVSTGTSALATIDLTGTPATNAAVTGSVDLTAGLADGGSDITFDINGETVTLTTGTGTGGGGNFSLSDIVSAINGTANVGVTASDDGAGHLVLTSTGTAGAADAIVTSGTAAAGLGIADATVNGSAAVPLADVTFQINSQTVTLAGGSSYTANQIRDAINTQVGTSASVAATIDGTGNLVLTSTGTAGAADAIVTSGTAAAGLGVADATVNGSAAAPLADLTFQINSQTVTLAGGSSYTANQIRDAINTQVGTSASVAATIDGSGNLVLTSTGTAGASDAVTVGTFSSGTATQLGFAGATATGNGSDSSGGLAGLTLNIAATGSGTATAITFGTGTGQVRSLNDLNSALAGNNLQATLSSTGVLSITTTNDAASATIGAITGTAAGVGQPFNGLTAAAPVRDAAAQLVRSNLVAQYNNILDQITTTSQDASFNGVNLLNGDQLKLTFNEKGTSTLNIQGVQFNATGLSLSKLAAGTDFLDNASAFSAIRSLDAASSTLRTQASALGSNLSIVQIRQDFSKNLINVLQTGSSNLTLADTNEEAANSQALSTRQSIAVSALALANQSQQSVLQLLR